MNLSLAGILLLLSIRYAKWSKWREYYPTLLYLALLNMLYLYICKTPPLWLYKSSILPQMLLDLIIVFIVQGAMGLLFLSYHPQLLKHKLLYWSAWVIVFSVLEEIFYLADRLDYFKGWNIWWSVVFYIIMFPMLYLHYKKPIIALLLSIPITLGFMWIFDYF